MFDAIGEQPALVGLGIRMDAEVRQKIMGAAEEISDRVAVVAALGAVGQGEEHFPAEVVQVEASRHIAERSKPARTLEIRQGFSPMRGRGAVVDAFG